MWPGRGRRRLSISGSEDFRFGGLPGKTTLAIATFLAMAAVLAYGPMPEGLRLRRLSIGGPAPAAGQPRGEAAGVKPAAVEEPGLPEIVDPGGAMGHFYEALRRTDGKQPGAITRVLHYGDSPVTADSITADVRALLQTRFGDAGHGFVLIAKPWAWYGHRGVDLQARGWRISPATQARARDGYHGLGGVSFEGGAGAFSTVTLADDGHTKAEVDYLRQPGGGVFEVEAKGTTLGTVDTGGTAKEPGFAAFALPEGTESVTLRVTQGTVRLFGWTFEKNGPGVIYHSLGLNGGQIQAVLRYFEPEQWAGQLRHQRPDLVVINYGTNESVFPEYIERYYPDELRKVIARVKADVPEASVLVMGPMDRGERDAGGDIVTVPVLPRIVELQREIAAETGCAFFDTFEAMGGAGTMRRWYEAQPRLVSADFMHPLPAGAAKVGGLLYGAMMRGYGRFADGAR